jgi:twitching motility protein PilI
MAERISLRDYQRDLAERLRNAERAGGASKLGILVGGENWLVDLGDAGEVIPVPPISAVPLTRPWFKGVANIRGNLCSVVDFSAFLGGGPAAPTDQRRLLLVSERFRLGAALLVDRSLGLHNAAGLRSVAGAAAWTRAEYEDGEGRRWKELDLPQLAQHADFLSVGM